MKAVKILMIAIIALFTFEGAKAQVVVKARVGAPVHRHYYRHPVRRAVVIRHNHYHHRPIVVRHVYHRPHRRVVTRAVIR